MPFIIVDERNVDRALTAKEWRTIKRTGWMLETVGNLINGETVDSNELADEIDEKIKTIPHAMQKLVAYALGGNRVRVQEEKDLNNG